MSRTRAYTLGNNGFVYRPILDLLGQPAHVRQARVIIVASSKVAAACFYNDRKTGMRVEDGEVHLCHGNDLDALTSAGLTKRETVYAVPLDGPQPVVEITGDGTARVVGRLIRDDSTGKPIFIPEGNPEMTELDAGTPGQAPR